MAAAGVAAFILIINLCRGIQRFFQIVRTHQRRRAVHTVTVTYRFRNVDKTILGIQLLCSQFGTEHRLQISQLYRLQGTRMQNRTMVGFHVRADIIPLLRNFILTQINFIRIFCHGFSSPIYLFLYITVVKCIIWFHYKSIIPCCQGDYPAVLHIFAILPPQTAKNPTGMAYLSDS